MWNFKKIETNSNVKTITYLRAKNNNTDKKFL